MRIDPGKPAEPGTELILRRYRLVHKFVSFLTKRGKAVLDYGCGNGAQTRLFQRDAMFIMGCDIYADKFPGNTSIIFTKLLEDGTIPVVSENFDVAYCFDVLEHVEDEDLVLKEIFRVLTSAGDFIITVPNKWWLFEVHGAWLPLLPWNRIPFFSWLPNKLHSRWAKARIYRKKDIACLLEANGFVVKTIEYMTAPLDVLRSSILKKILQSTLFFNDTTKIPFFATSIVVHCTKKI